MKLAAWATAFAIVTLNAYLAWNTFSSAIHSSGSWADALGILSAVISLALLALLVFLTVWPFVRRDRLRQLRVALAVEAPAAEPSAVRSYSSILVPLDHTKSDSDAISNAVAVAKSNDAELILLHIEEGVPSRLYGSLSSTAEVNEGQDYLNQLADKVRSQGLRVKIEVRHGANPAKQIAQAALTLRPDLVVMAAHGHRGLKDLIFGSTINKVRHHLKIPILIVQGKDGK